MKFQTALLAACVAFITTANGAPKSSSTTSTSSVSSVHSTITSSVSTTHSTTASTKSSSSSSSSSKTSTSSTKSVTPSATSVATTYDINFDERTVIPGVPALNPVGIEDTIFFNSWVLDNPSAVNLQPHSPPNLIFTAVEQQTTNGTPSLTVIYPGSNLKSFDFHSFWFGCALDTAEGVAGVAAQCTIAVAGFQNDKEVAVASFTFTPALGVTAVPMIQAVLPSNFVSLQNVTIVQGDPTVDVLGCDDFIVTTHT